MEDLHHELRFAAVFTVLLDVALWVVSGLIAGWTVSVPLGLALGSAGMLVNMLLLRRTVQGAVYRGRTKTLGSYLVRMLIASGVITAGLLLDQVSAPAAVIPFLYPKLIFGVLAVRSK